MASVHAARMVAFTLLIEGRQENVHRAMMSLALRDGCWLGAYTSRWCTVRGARGNVGGPTQFRFVSLRFFPLAVQGRRPYGPTWVVEFTMSGIAMLGP